MTSITRVGNPPPADFYIKGSYVLDVVFKTTFARDADVFCDRMGRQPSRDEMDAWLSRVGLPPPRTWDITPVDGLDDCSGGGTAVFSFERWHIRSDGKLYTLVDTDEKSDQLLYGPLFKTQLVDFRPTDAERIATPITLIDWTRDKTHLLKLALKFQRFPGLGATIFLPWILQELARLGVVDLDTELRLIGL